ncbi:glycosyltransferase family 39 protein [Myxococcus xanthus]|uniref:ArnT family glycosyltransferase n=1 Tax=Myxococcus xanthus TaxID=34 RepID=UPI001917708C|nr:glycosyltransferase family 39 protein [Myxococcus xanthus]QQR43100.1 glycosyltransferase family 39 protein [Myxococcus xanthus]
MKSAALPEQGNNGRWLGFGPCLRILPRVMATAPAPFSVSPPHAPGLSAVPAPQHEPGTRLLVGLLLVAALLPRLGVFFVNENLFGDAVVRTELAERWLRAPHIITAYGDGAYQFGPLHMYLVGAALSVFDREVAGRVVSLLFGVLSVVPLFALTRRLFGWRAGVVAGLSFAAWGMHMQFSTTASSEAVSLFFMLATFALYAEGVDDNRFLPLFQAALMLNLACALRYDAWMYIPLLTVALCFSSQDKVVSLTRAVGFGLVCLPFPLLWMQGNELMHGNPFFPVVAVEDFHRNWVKSSLGSGSNVLWRLQQLGFWPGIALLTLSPLVALLGMAGMVRAWRSRPDTRWLVAAAVLPAAYFTFRAAVLLTFVPLGRFTVTQVALLPVFVAFGFAGLVATRGGPMLRKALAGVTVLVAVAVPVAMGVYTFRADGPLQSTMRPISPTSTNPVALMQVAKFLKAEVAAKGGAAALDVDPNYMDLQLAFFSGLPEERLARVRWDTFRQRMQEARPEVLVRFDGGALANAEGVTLEERSLVLDGVAYQKLDGFTAPLHVYRRQP